MTNENKKINELVSDDDDLTAELETLTVRLPMDDHHGADDSEVDADTFDFESLDGEATNGISVAKLKNDLKLRSETIERLQFDIEQLSAKWSGLEAEIKAREDLTSKLSANLKSAERKLERKEQLLQKREQTIQSLKSDNREWDEKARELEQTAQDHQHTIAELQASDEIQVTRQQLSEKAGQLTSAEARLSEIQAQQHRTERYADDIRHQFMDLKASSANAYSERDALKEAMSFADVRLVDLESQLNGAIESHGATTRTLIDAEAAHAEEIRTLRFEFAAASDTLTESQRLNEQLAGDMVEIRSSGEQKLSVAEEQYIARAQEFQSELESLQQSNADYEQKLAAKGTEFGVLQTELKNVTDSSATTSQAMDAAAAAHEEENRAFQQAKACYDAELASKGQEISALQDELKTVVGEHEAANLVLNDTEAAHEEEIQSLRLELREASELVSEQKQQNNQFADDLAEAHRSRDELEQQLLGTEEQKLRQIEDLEKQVESLQQAAADHEAKLESKGEAISALLDELAKKSREFDSIGEMEEVIHDIDDRMSERIEDRPAAERERITRVLIGHIDDQELRFPLFKDRLTIGRTQQNDIQIKAQHISRRHAVVVTEGDATRVVDWGSKNGVYVNSKRVTEQFLKNGDLVTIGTAEFRFEERRKRDN